MPPDAWLEYQVEMIGFEPVEEVRFSLYYLAQVKCTPRCRWWLLAEKIWTGGSFVMWVAISYQNMLYQGESLTSPTQGCW